MDLGGPGDASLQSAQSSEAGKTSNSPNAALRDGCISVALQPPVCSFGWSVGLDVFLAGGGGISRSKEDYEAHEDKGQGRGWMRMRDDEG